MNGNPPISNDSNQPSYTFIFNQPKSETKPQPKPQPKPSRWQRVRRVFRRPSFTRFTTHVKENNSAKVFIVGFLFAIFATILYFVLTETVFKSKSTSTNTSADTSTVNKSPYKNTTDITTDTTDTNTSTNTKDQKSIQYEIDRAPLLEQYNKLRSVIFKNTEYLGCYMDDPKKRRLDEYLGQKSTFDECVASALAKGYQYIGIQDSIKYPKYGCWAGNNRALATKQQAIGISLNKLCGFKRGHPVGGYNVNAVYSIGVNNFTDPGDPTDLTNEELKTHIDNMKKIADEQITYLGCYKDCDKKYKSDDPKARTLPIVQGRVSSIRECANIAKQGGKKYFGLQFRKKFGDSAECWIGDDYDRSVSLGKATNCTSYGNMLTGGACSNALYKIGV